MAKYVPQAEMSLSDQMQIRRDKLNLLRAEGMDPFVQTKYDVTTNIAAVRDDFDALEGSTVSLSLIHISEPTRPY